MAKRRKRKKRSADAAGAAPGTGSAPASPANGGGHDEASPTAGVPDPEPGLSRLPPWARWAAFLTLVGLHAFLLVRVANPSPHSGGDNAGYLTLAYSLVTGGEYTDLYDPAQPPHTKYPPVFPLVLAGAMALGARTWASFKAVSAIAILLSVALASAWAWRRRGWGFGIAIGLLLAFADSLLYHSQWILSDPVFLALTMAALLAFDRVESLVRDGPPLAGTPARGERRWLGIGCAAAILAFFTRSAGLPLVLAVFAWLALRRRWRALGIYAMAFGAPALLWWLRSRALGGPGYTGEFWMVNPYQPDLGTIGPLALVGRLVANLQHYLWTAIPGGLLGMRTTLSAVLGSALVLAAIVGWAKRLKTPGVAELFVPLYFGLILLWPQVWSGDRFALPLFAPLLFYAGEALVRMTREVHRWAPVAALTVMVAVLLLPGTMSWRSYARQAAVCRERVRTGAFHCYQARMQEFAAAAEWSRDNLPEGAVVLTRKPRLFFVVSGVRSSVFPFSDDPQALADAAGTVGARYLIMDYLDNVSAFYLVPILEKRPALFCSIRGFGGDERGIQTQLMGLDPAASGDRRVTQTDDGQMRVNLDMCELSEYLAEGAVLDAPAQSDPSGVVPLLRSLDS